MADPLPRLVGHTHEAIHVQLLRLLVVLCVILQVVIDLDLRVALRGVRRPLNATIRLKFQFDTRTLLHKEGLQRIMLLLKLPHVNSWNL